MLDQISEVAIIGAGVFGLSTALALARRHPDLKIHVIDRFEPPVPDGSSTDTTRCLRFDYTQSIYADLSKKSLEIVKADPELASTFHQTGMTFVYDGKKDKWGKIWDSQLEHVQKLKGNVILRNSPAEVFTNIHGSPYPQGHQTRWNKAYTNMDCGFIEADNAMKIYYEKCKKYSQIVFTFQEVDKIIYEQGTAKAKGIKFVTGAYMPVKLIIVAAGAWSCKLVDMSQVSRSTCIEVGWYKITDEEAEKWKNMSITTNLSTGINIFPPLNNEIKVLRRSPGFKNTITVQHPDPLTSGTQQISYPRTSVTNPNDWMPLAAEQEIRKNMVEMMPPLAKRPFDRTKVCWLTQTASANFLIDYHPNLQGVMMATCGSAHAWKFVPVIGDKVVDFLNGHLAPELQALWSWQEKLGDKADNGSAPRMTGPSPEMEHVMRKKTEGRL